MNKFGRIWLVNTVLQKERCSPPTLALQNMLFLQITLAQTACLVINKRPAIQKQ